MRHMILIVAAVSFAVLAGEIKPVPPPGAEITAADREELLNAVAALGKEIDTLRSELKGKPALELLPDVQIYHNAVRYAVNHNEFYNLKEPAKDVALAKDFIRQGMERAQQLRAGKPGWTIATGLVARGYVSKIDGSVQPYGLVVPDSYQGGPAKFRLDIWYHGRGETLSELNFINDRQKNRGEFTPRDSFVLHPYGRYCNANKFAGEVDTFEALDAVKKHYRIDENRIAVRGFSMGGAACWQFATHYASLWAAAAPGAGFSETPDFVGYSKRPEMKPFWFEEKLWHLYDATDYAANLFNCPTVAYSGEIDGQKQAADMMERALEKQGIAMVHIIGPKTAHKYETGAKAEINRRIDSIMAQGRDPLPKKIRFATWTLRYNKMAWLTIDEIEKHWEFSGIEADRNGRDTVTLVTQNVTALTIDMPPGLCPFDVAVKPKLRIDNQELDTPQVMSDRSWTVKLHKGENGWQLGARPPSLRKAHGLQGPIDDAFMDSFVMVKPTGKAFNEKVGAWTAAETAHAIDFWRKQYRGEARITDDAKLSDAEISSGNIVLWGDPSSNAVLAKIADKLPIKWSATEIKVGAKTYDATTHTLLMIYPNPLNPGRYVVLNSGHTFREWHNLNNARQNAILPDWVVVNTTEDGKMRYPGGIAAAGFFDEGWQLKDEGK